MHLERTRDPARALVIDAPTGEITSARIWHCKYRTLAPLRSCKGLTSLVIATYPDESLDLLESFPGLRHLRVLHMPKVADLGPIATLRSLTTLSLATAVEWDQRKRVLTVTSLAPIAGLPCLEQLELYGIVTEPRSLQPLVGMPKLMRAAFSGYPTDEVRAFYGASGCSDQLGPAPE